MSVILQVKHFVIYAVAKVTFIPFKEELPCFGAMTLSIIEPVRSCFLFEYLILLWHWAYKRVISHCRKVIWWRWTALNRFSIQVSQWQSGWNARSGKGSGCKWLLFIHIKIFFHVLLWNYKFIHIRFQIFLAMDPYMQGTLLATLMDILVWPNRVVVPFIPGDYR
jgi:hypothetical protein